MADDDNAPAESFGSDPNGLAQAVAAQREHRAVAEVSADYDPAVPEPEAEPSARKLTDTGEGELSARQAGREPQ